MAIDFKELRHLPGPGGGAGFHEPVRASNFADTPHNWLNLQVFIQLSPQVVETTGYSSVSWWGQRVPNVKLSFEKVSQIAMRWLNCSLNDADKAKLALVFAKIAATGVHF